MIHRFTIFSIALALCFINTYAQDNLPPVFEITTDTIPFVLLPESDWQVLEEDEGVQWTIEQVTQSPLANRFHTNTGFNYQINTYWVRYRLKNRVNRSVKIFAASNAAFNDAFAKLQSQQEWQHMRTGVLVPWSEKEGIKAINAIAFVIPPDGEILVYRRITYNFIVNRPEYFRLGIQFRLDEARSDVMETTVGYLEDIINAIVLGFFLLTAILSFFFYGITREKAFIIAAVGYLTLVLLFFSQTLFLIFREHPLEIRYAWRFVDGLVPFIVVHVIRSFLRTQFHIPKWDKALIIISLISLLDIVLRFTNPNIVIGSKGQFIVFVALLITCLTLIRRKDKTARLVVFGVLPLLVYVVGENILELWSVIIPNGFQLYYIGLRFLVFLWLIVSLNRILFYRYRQLQANLMEGELENQRLAKEREMERRILIEQQKTELENQVEARTEQLRQSLDDLKATQSQLIQSEKMASLGELTAGIAHEIQNPLNFVNNFSEVSTELVDEMKEELAIGNHQLAIEIAIDLKQNLEKINHHGKRAGDIVKGMLQHSRSSSGVKEPTDINALADEYLRLAYHGLRAKDKSFNATMKTDFDESIGNINIIPQDIGRVILNLITNAFYVVTEKATLRQAQGASYEPTVSVSTKKESNKVLISVKDNGNGIPQKILDKIFQPFFTTKPTGQGTGLGLSLSYDIVKAHGGTLEVESAEGVGTEFVIQLPTKNNGG